MLCEENWVLKSVSFIEKKAQMTLRSALTSHAELFLISSQSSFACSFALWWF